LPAPYGFRARSPIYLTFPASGDERIVRFLMERFGVKVDEDEREIRISPR